MNAYEQKQEARRARLEARAERLRREAEAKVGRAREMASAIPFGQPILVGHHSEKRDRAYRGKIEAGFRSGFETMKAAEQAAAKAERVGTGGVSSDDPEAVAKLKRQLEALEASQERMVKANKAVRKSDRGALAALGFDEQHIESLFRPDFCGRTGFPNWQLSNNNANIRRIKQRIEALELASKRETVEKEQAGVRIVENAEANRLQLFFPSKPEAEIRAELKSRGFRWAPSEGAWQRQLNNGARYAAECVLRKIEQEG